MKAQLMPRKSLKLGRDLWIWIGFQAVFAFFAIHVLFGAGFTWAALPPSAPRAANVGNLQITDDTALYQNISEINSPRLGTVDFDSDLDRLSQMERRYVDRARVTMPRSGNVRGKSSAAPRRR